MPLRKYYDVTFAANDATADTLENKRINKNYTKDPFCVTRLK